MQLNVFSYKTKIGIKNFFSVVRFMFAIYNYTFNCMPRSTISVFNYMIKYRIGIISNVFSIARLH